MRTMARKPDLLFNVHSLALLSGNDLHFSDEDGDQVLINSCAPSCTSSCKLLRNILRACPFCYSTLRQTLLHSALALLG